MTADIFPALSTGSSSTRPVATKPLAGLVHSHPEALASLIPGERVS